MAVLSAGTFLLGAGLGRFQSSIWKEIGGERWYDTPLSFWMPKGACSPRVNGAVNGAMIEVSEKRQHSGLGRFVWDQGLDVGRFAV